MEVTVQRGNGVSQEGVGTDGVRERYRVIE